jgi:hypothetical protein
MPQPPAEPKIYHIVHVDRLASIIADGCLWADAVMVGRAGAGTTIGMGSIKQRRLTLPIACRPGLRVGDCVPFYFCPRSIMLYLIDRANHPELTYRGGQGPIIHLEADLRAAVEWAEQNRKGWAFTLSNAGANYFEDLCNLDQLHEINWEGVHANRWAGTGISAQLKEGKQAEFLMEERFPWNLVTRVGVLSQAVAQQVSNVLRGAAHQPGIEIRRDWYY